jgi:hypothetical protein
MEKRKHHILLIDNIKPKKMKKIIFSLAVLTALLSSCKKETKTCNCGTILSDNVSNYSVNIKNDCSGNVKNWVLSEADWMTAYVGTHYCITNTNSW